MEEATLFFLWAVGWEQEVCLQQGFLTVMFKRQFGMMDFKVV